MPALRIMFVSLALPLAGELPACLPVFCRGFSSLAFLEIFGKVAIQPQRASLIDRLCFGRLFILL